MLPQGCGLRAGDRSEKTVLLAGGKRRGFEEGNGLLQDSRIACHFDITRYGIGQPEEVIRTVCPHSAARFRVPPMLNVAFAELTPRARQDVRASHFRRGIEERQGVL